MEVRARMRLSSRSSFLTWCLIAGASVLAAGSGFDPHLLHHREAASVAATAARTGHDHSASGFELPVQAAHSPLCILCASRHLTASTAAPTPDATPPAEREASSPLPARLACGFLLAGPGSPRAPPANSHPA